MSNADARLARAERAAHQRTLAELARRRGVLRWVCYASDAEPDPAYPGYWRSETFELLLTLPGSLAQRGMAAIGYEWEIEPDPNHDEEPGEAGTNGTARGAFGANH